MTAASIDWMLRRDRAVALAAIGLVALGAWAYVLFGAGMDGMEMGEAMEPMPWTFGYFALMLLMWAAMMVAMMLPGAAPIILLFATINRKRRGDAASRRPISLFGAGYIAVWVGFSILATLLQWRLQQVALLSPSMASSSVILSALLLFAAGAYQLTPLKQACLRHCRSPLEFLSEHWREGSLGAFQMGVRHGAFCAGCCWMLMGLLFVSGLMNIVWIAALSLYVLAEKTIPAGSFISRLLGIGLIIWGTAGLVSALR